METSLVATESEIGPLGSGGKGALVPFEEPFGAALVAGGDEDETRPSVGGVPSSVNPPQATAARKAVASRAVRIGPAWLERDAKDETMVEVVERRFESIMPTAWAGPSHSVEQTDGLGRRSRTEPTTDQVSSLS
jgi:hypothetical protein